jgi:hypothetical protein
VGGWGLGRGGCWVGVGVGCVVGGALGTLHHGRHSTSSNGVVWHICGFRLLTDCWQQQADTRLVRARLFAKLDAVKPVHAAASACCTLHCGCFHQAEFADENMRVLVCFGSVHMHADHCAGSNYWVALHTAVHYCTGTVQAHVWQDQLYGMRRVHDTWKYCIDDNRMLRLWAVAACCGRCSQETG